jgi:hypothetical protein
MSNVVRTNPMANVADHGVAKRRTILSNVVTVPIEVVMIQLLFLDTNTELPFMLRT